MPPPPRVPEGHRTTAAADGALADPEIKTTGTERLPYLAEVSEAMIDTLDSGPSPTRLAELAVSLSRLFRWAVLTFAGEDGGRGEQTSAQRDPGRRAALNVYMTGRLGNTGDDGAMVEALLSGQPV
jgi:sigma-B regulation protein RsbU (phosphoserine phosphatase)